MLLAGATLAAGCGLESLFFVRPYQRTPEPHGLIKGRVAGVPGTLDGRLQGANLTARALAVDGRVLASTTTQLNQDFTLDLAPKLGDVYSVRVVLSSGSVVLRGVVTEVPDGTEVSVGDVGLVSTASTLLLEAYAATARSGLAGTPPSVAAKVLENAQDTSKPAVAAFQEAITAILDATDPNRGTAAFDDATGAPPEDILAAASLTPAAYLALRQAAVEAVGVPVVCDASRIRAMFTVDVSGQALDGNGKRQFMRQAPKEGRVFLGITLDPSSPVPDSARALKSRLTPNDPDTEMYDDGTHGDEVAGDQVFTRTLDLPRGMRVIYKFTNGSPGEGYTGTEEWPGNARILEMVDLLTGDALGKPDCLVIRRDSFGDESSNKNFVNLHASLGGGSLSYQADLGGAVISAAPEAGRLPVGGLGVDSLKTVAPLTPAGIPEARENGSCVVCPPPITVPVDDSVPPRVVQARFSSTDEVVVLFSEDLDLASASQRDNYLLMDDAGVVTPVRRTGVAGALVTLSVDTVDPRKTYTLHVKDVADASLERNAVAEGTKVVVGADTTAPRIVEARGSTITDLNPAARPLDPRGGEVVVVTFSEVLDRIAAENAGSYQVEGPDGLLGVYAAFQRGRDVLLVTDPIPGGVEHSVRAHQLFDVAGNIISQDSTALFTGLKLFKVQLNAVPGHAWLSVDGRDRGLPPGEGLYVTGTIMLDARALDGADLRAQSRTDVTGVSGFRLEPVEAPLVSGKPVHRLELLLPAGTYAYKFAHGRPSDAANPPATLEAVTKSLATTADATGVQVNPITMVGDDGISYAGARLSLTGNDPPAAGVLFKRENPDCVVQVVDQDVVAPTWVVGAWRDVPFGRGKDYDDGLREFTMPVVGVTDSSGPLPIAAEARDSESVLLSFDKAISTRAADLEVSITDEAGAPLPSTVLVVGIPRPTQAVLKTGPMGLGRGYTVLVSRSADTAGHATTEPKTVAYAAPGAYTPFTPVVDSDPPVVNTVVVDGPTSLTVKFSERVAATAAEVARYTIELRAGGAGPAVTAARLVDAGRAVRLTTAQQGFREAYTLVVTNIDDQATPPNRLLEQRVSFEGFGDSDAPTLLWAKPMGPDRVVLKFSEPVGGSSASTASNYLLTGGVAVRAALGSGSDSVRVCAFNTDWAPFRRDLVVLSTDPMQAGTDYTVTATGVLDISGNASSTTATFTAVGTRPQVTVLLRYLVSQTSPVLGAGQGGAAAVPARAISPQTLASQREGLFLLGTALTEDGATPVQDSPVTRTLSGFPAEGSPLDGAEPAGRDDGQGGDETAGDNIFTVRVDNVPLGTVISYKAFASYSVAYRDAHPEDPLAAFADATPGPFVFSDGQEFPGNDNAAWILADEDGDGKVVLDNLFGDEVTFKRKTGFRPFAWVTDAWRRAE
jgi:hypothetical protein